MSFTTTVIRNHTFETATGEEIDLPYAAADYIDPFLSEDGNLFRYAVEDHDRGWDYEWQEGVEFIQGSPRHHNYVGDADAANAWIEEMAVDHDIFSVDVYEHGNVVYSLSGTGPQCAFDTARGGAAIAIPNDKHADPFTNTEEAARAILAEFTDWVNGNIYGIVEMIRDPETGEWAEGDACWGIIGDKYAQQCVNEGGY